MSQQTTNIQPEKKPMHVNNTLGFSLAASMLLAACGGGTDAVPPATAPDVQQAAIPEVPVAQPAWGSIGVLVAPGQASKVFSFPDGSCQNLGEGSNLYNISLAVSSIGDVTLKAATRINGSSEEWFALKLADTTTRDTHFTADGSVLTAATYSMTQGTSKNFTLVANQERAYLNVKFPPPVAEPYLVGIVCDNGPITLASLTPASAFLPSEQRLAKGMLNGVTQAGTFDTAYVDANRVFYWTPASNRVNDGYALNLADGSINQGKRDGAQGLSNTPVPTRVSFAGLASGRYSETYRNRGLDIRKVSFASAALTQDLTRIADVLHARDCFIFTCD